MPPGQMPMKHHTLSRLSVFFSASHRGLVATTPSTTCAGSMQPSLFLHAGTVKFRSFALWYLLSCSSAMWKMRCTQAPPFRHAPELLELLDMN